MEEFSSFICNLTYASLLNVIVYIYYAVRSYFSFPISLHWLLVFVIYIYICLVVILMIFSNVRHKYGTFHLDHLEYRKKSSFPTKNNALFFQIDFRKVCIEIQ